MKPSAIIIIIFIALVRCSPYVGSKVMDYPKPFQFVLIDSLNATKDKLYIKANEWMAKKYVSSKAVIQMQDKEAGKIVGKAIMDVHNQAGPSYNYETVDYIITIDVKEGKYRCVLSNFSHSGGVFDHKPYGGVGTLEQERSGTKWPYIKDVAMQTSADILNDLKTYLRSKDDDF